jgi:hypothetical protein
MGTYPTPLDQRLSSLINRLDRRVTLLEVNGTNTTAIGGVLAQQTLQSPDFSLATATGWGLNALGGGTLQNITIIHQPTPSNQLVGDDAMMTSSIGGWAALANCSAGYGLAPDNATECIAVTIGQQSGAPAVIDNASFYQIPVSPGDTITVSAKWWAPSSGTSVQHAIMFEDLYGGPIEGGSIGLLGGTYALTAGSFQTVVDTVTAPTGAAFLSGLQATLYNGAINQVFYNAAWTVQDASTALSAQAGLYVYNGSPGPGTPPVFAAVPPGTLTDTYGNSLINEVGTIPNAVVIVGSSIGPQLFLEPEAAIVFGAGILETVMRLSSGEANELMDGLVGAMIANQGAAYQQMAVVLAAPAPANTVGNSCALVLTAESDDGTIQAALTYGIITTDGESETFNPCAVLLDSGSWLAQTYIAYAEGTGPVIVVYNSAGSHTFTPPGGVSVCKAEDWGGGASGGGTDSAGDGYSGGGGGAGEYACEPALAVTPLTGVAVTVGGGGAAAAPGSNGNGGGNSSIVGTSVTVLAHGGGGGFKGNVSGPNGAGGTPGSGSINTIHYPGGAGAGGIASGQGYNIAGGGGAAAGTAGAGQAGGTVSPEQGGIGADGGGSGGTGFIWGGPPPTNGQTPGGGGGGQARPGHSSATGAAGLARITYTPPTNVPVASLSGVSTTDLSGNPIPAGLYGTLTLPQQASAPGISITGDPVLFGQADGAAGIVDASDGASYNIQRKTLIVPSGPGITVNGPALVAVFSTPVAAHTYRISGMYSITTPASSPGAVSVNINAPAGASGTYVMFMIHGATTVTAAPASPNLTSPYAAIGPTLTASTTYYLYIDGVIVITTAGTMTFQAESVITGSYVINPYSFMDVMPS